MVFFADEKLADKVTGNHILNLSNGTTFNDLIDL